MENKLRFCDYLNHATFMRIEDEGNHYKLTMKSIVIENKFYMLDRETQIPAYRYYLEFSKAIL